MGYRVPKDNTFRFATFGPCQLQCYCAGPHLWVQAAGKLTINWGVSLGGVVGTVGGHAPGVEAVTLEAAGVAVGGMVSGLLCRYIVFVLLF